MPRSLFPRDQGIERTVRLRVVGLTETHTLVQSLDDESEQWSFVASRLPKAWPIRSEFRMTFTPMELEYLQGNRELEKP